MQFLIILSIKMIHLHYIAANNFSQFFDADVRDFPFIHRYWWHHSTFSTCRYIVILCYLKTLQILNWFWLILSSETHGRSPKRCEKQWTYKFVCKLVHHHLKSYKPGSNFSFFFPENCNLTKKIPETSDNWVMIHYVYDIYIYTNVQT